MIHQRNFFIRISVFFLLFIVSSAFAESIAVKRGQVFIADRGLVVKNAHTGQLNHCSASRFYDPHGNDVTDLLGTATDVVVKHGHAIVTVHPLDSNGNPFVDSVTVDVRSCFSDRIVTESVEECISTVDMKKGILIIPCVDMDGRIYTVHMDRRGKSDNWEVSFSQDHPHLRHYRSRDYDDDDHDRNYNHNHNYDDD